MSVNSKGDVGDGDPDKKGFYVTPKLDCPHLQRASMIMPGPDSPTPRSESLQHTASLRPCVGCQSTEENWVCLTCGECFCSRYVKGHMVKHNEQSGHPIAASFSDLSIWCYDCDAYIKNDVFAELLVEMHTSKFGHAPPKPKDDLIPFITDPEVNRPDFPEPRTKQEIYSARIRQRAAECMAKVGASDSQASTSSASSSGSSSSSSAPSTSYSDGRRRPWLNEVQTFDAKKFLKPTTTHETREIEIIAVKGHGYSGSAEDIHDYYDDEDAIKQKAKMLADLIRNARKCLVYTGAGVSTSAKIPDYRSASGVWTMQDRGGIKRTKVISLEEASPTFTHRAIAELVRVGKVALVVSTNIDGLHMRSGVPMEKLVELHGNCFIEECATCSKKYVRDYTVTSKLGTSKVDLTRETNPRVRHHATGRKCDSCGGALIDTIIAFGENLPEFEIFKAVQVGRDMDLSIVLGTSMKVKPASMLPGVARANGGKMCIVNLQKTPHEPFCWLHLFDATDKVMELVMEELGIRVPSTI